VGRYTGPVEKLERREGVDLGLKGWRRLAGKTSLDRRGALPPGQHAYRRRGRPSVYAQQLRETQKLKITYGVRCDIASRPVVPDDVVSIRANEAVRAIAEEWAGEVGAVPGWLEADVEALSGRVLRRPERAEITAPVEEHLVIERYSR
jgi:ribosomal protein S4